jgi:hypothetical protein
MVMAKFLLLAGAALRARKVSAGVGTIRRAMQQAAPPGAAP